VSPSTASRTKDGAKAAQAAPETHGYTGNKDAHLKRLARIEGQVRGIARMVDEDKYCIDVLTQVSAVTKALQAVSLGLLEEHMAHCVANAVAAGGDEGAAKLKEASDAIARLVRS
jgi:CsoR family transcriptional regulator, copper-sensing transcriptional repressor